MPNLFFFAKRNVFTFIFFVAFVSFNFLIKALLLYFV